MGCCACQQEAPLQAVGTLLHSIHRSWPAGAGPISQQEYDELQKLRPCQAQAVLHVRKRCARLNREFLPILMQRAEILGFSPQEVVQTLAYIRDEAPLIIHLDIEKCGSQLAFDSHYRNLFETREECDAISIHANSRKDWERKLFGSSYNQAEPFDRVKYAVLNVTNDPQGVRCCTPIYGSSYLLLRGVRLRTTFSAEDSAELDASELATVDCYAHVLARFTDLELRATLEVGTKRRPGITSLTIMAYKEAQIHGEIRLRDHVELVMAHPAMSESSKAMVEKLALCCNAPLVWMDTAEDNGEVVASELMLDVMGAYQEMAAAEVANYEDQLLNQVLEASQEEHDAQQARARAEAEAQAGTSPADGATATTVPPLR